MKKKQMFSIVLHPSNSTFDDIKTNVEANTPGEAFDKAIKDAREKNPALKAIPFGGGIDVID